MRRLNECRGNPAGFSVRVGAGVSRDSVRRVGGGAQFSPPFGILESARLRQQRGESSTTFASPFPILVGSQGPLEWGLG